jgi:hypothetical protein
MAILVIYPLDARHPFSSSAYSAAWVALLRRRTLGKAESRGLAPISPASRSPAQCTRSPPAKHNSAVAPSVSQCHLATVSCLPEAPQTISNHHDCLFLGFAKYRGRGTGYSSRPVFPNERGLNFSNPVSIRPPYSASTSRIVTPIPRPPLFPIVEKLVQRDFERTRRFIECLNLRNSVSVFDARRKSKAAPSSPRCHPEIVSFLPATGATDH